MRRLEPELGNPTNMCGLGIPLMLWQFFANVQVSGVAYFKMEFNLYHYVSVFRIRWSK